MKTIYGFFTSLIIILLIAACSDSAAGPDDFQGQRIGNWLTTSESTAHWVGQTPNKPGNALSAIDTVFYDQPDQNYLEMHSVVISGEPQLILTYIDSTMTRSWFDSTGAAPHVHFDTAFSKGGGVISATPDLLQLDTNVRFSCDSTFSLPADLIKIGVDADSGGVYQTIQIDAVGFYAAADALICN